MARLIAGMGTSHVPGVGAALDNGKTDEAYWKPLLRGLSLFVNGMPTTFRTSTSLSLMTMQLHTP